MLLKSVSNTVKLSKANFWKDTRDISTCTKKLNFRVLIKKLEKYFRLFLDGHPDDRFVPNSNLTFTLPKNWYSNEAMRSKLITLLQIVFTFLQVKFTLLRIKFSFLKQNHPTWSYCSEIKILLRVCVKYNWTKNNIKRHKTDVEQSSNMKNFFKFLQTYLCYFNRLHVTRFFWIIQFIQF